MTVDTQNISQFDLNEPSEFNSAANVAAAAIREQFDDAFSVTLDGETYINASVIASLAKGYQIGAASYLFTSDENVGIEMVRVSMILNALVNQTQVV